jgi:hypothetical protein
MVAVTGDGNHGQSPTSPPNACIDGYLARYRRAAGRDRPGQRDLRGAAPALARELNAADPGPAGTGLGEASPYGRRDLNGGRCGPVTAA